MITKISIDLNRSWILEHRTDETLPVAALKNIAEKIENVTIERTTYATLIFTLPMSEKEAEPIVDNLIDEFGAIYNIEPHIIDDIVDVIYDEDDEAPEDKDGEGGASDGDDGKTLIEDVFNSLFDDDDDDDDDEDDDDEDDEDDGASDEDRVAECLKKIDNMTGGSDFKRLAREICNVAPFI